MAWQLIDEVLRLAPATLTEGERLVVLAIASEVHQSNLAARTCTVAVAHLAHITGMAPSSVTSAMTRLRKTHGLDVRVPISLTGGRGGGPLYTVSGRLPTFRVPPLLSNRECPCSSCGSRKGLAAVADPPDGGSAVAAGGSAVAAGGSAVAAGGSAVAEPNRVTGITGFPSAGARDPRTVVRDALHSHRGAGPAAAHLPDDTADLLWAAFGANEFAVRKGIRDYHGPVEDLLSGQLSNPNRPRATPAQRPPARTATGMTAAAFENYRSTIN